MAYRLTRTAEDQIEATLRASVRDHGLAAAERYGALILAAMAAVGVDPCLVGSAEIAGVPGIRAYPTRLARRRVAPDLRVGHPRHLVIYRVAGDGTVEILGLVHDRMVLSRAAATLARPPGTDP